MKRLYHLVALSMCLLLSTSAASVEPALAPVYSTIMMPASDAAAGSNEWTAALSATEGFGVSWRLAVRQPSDLRYDAKHGAFSLYEDSMPLGVSPSGVRVRADAPDRLPPPSSPAYVSAEEDAVLGAASGDAGQAAWTYRLPAGRTLLPGSLHADLLGNVYFQDDRSGFYSLAPNGAERYVLRFDDLPASVRCLAAPHGDAACLSASFGMIGLRGTDDAPKLFVDGREQGYAQPPLLVEGSAFVPFRALSESLGASVKWEESNRTVEARLGRRTIRIAIGRKEAAINGRIVPAAAPAFIRDGTAYVPLRMAGEALGMAVYWENATRTIQVVTKSE